MLKLPIDPYLAQIQELLRKSDALIITATPGSGKTTRVPPLVMKAIQGSVHPKVYVLEPRRLAARLSAERVAEEQGLKLGQDVGYQFRFEKNRTAQTPLVFLTEGMLMRELLSNPSLEGVGIVILDEFHERHLQGDLAIAVLKKLQATDRPDLKVIVMSATLEVEPLKKYWEEAEQVISHVDVKGEVHPLHILYLDIEGDYLDRKIKKAIIRLLEMPDHDQYGDVLVFLPGMADIRRCEEALSEFKELEVVPLHGELTQAEQTKALNRATKKKVILSTNIAESSLTIPGVNTVIDSGLARVASVSHWSGLPHLKTKKISRSSATQRAGRSARTAPGLTIRLYGKADHDGRAFADVSEIKRSDLSQAVLELLSLGVDQIAQFPWFEAPTVETLKSTIAQLWRLGAIEETGSTQKLTELGRRMVEIPLHPRLSRVLIESEKRNCTENAIDAVTVLSEEIDVGLDFLEGLKKIASSPQFERARSKIQSRFSNLSKKRDAQALLPCLLAGFSDRVALKKGNQLLLSQGGSIEALPEEGFMGSELFLLLDVSETQRLGERKARSRVSALAAIHLEMLFDLEPFQLEDITEIEWNETKKRWLKHDSLRFQALTLTEKISEVKSEDLKADQVLPTLIGAWMKQYRDEFTTLGARYDLAIQHFGDEFEFKDFQSLVFNALKEQWQGEISVSQLPDFENFMLGWFPSQTKKALDEIAPLTVDLPYRKKAKVIYESGQLPRVESRLQDFFTMLEGPTYLRKRKKLSLHLLAPNYRAVQVTEDIAGFWSRHYPEIKKELSRRYPRHKWPENPLLPGDYERKDTRR
jgi:ATP-dependent helicase HrpB